MQRLAKRDSVAVEAREELIKKAQKEGVCAS